MAIISFSRPCFSFRSVFHQVTKQFAATKLQKMAQSTAKPVAKVSTTVQSECLPARASAPIAPHAWVFYA